LDEETNPDASKLRDVVSSTRDGMVVVVPESISLVRVPRMLKQERAKDQQCLVASEAGQGRFPLPPLTTFLSGLEPPQVSLRIESTSLLDSTEERLAKGKSW